MVTESPSVNYRDELSVVLVPSVTAVCSTMGIRLSVYSPPLDHQEPMTFGLVRSRCFKAVCVFVVFILSVHLFVSACICCVSVQVSAFKCFHRGVTEAFKSSLEDTVGLACLHTYFK